MKGLRLPVVLATLVVFLLSGLSGAAFASIFPAGPCMSTVDGNATVHGAAVDSEGNPIRAALIFFCDPAAGEYKVGLKSDTGWISIDGTAPTPAFIDCEDGTMYVRLFVNGTAQGSGPSAVSGLGSC